MRSLASLRPRKTARALLCVETLEFRHLLSVDLLPRVTGVAQPVAIGRATSAPSAPGIQPSVSSAISPPFTPAQIAHLYGFDQLPGYGTAGKSDGTGQTIAIIDAYDDPTIAADLKQFDRQFGLPDPTFIKATPQGTPAYDSGWALEISLDVEWAHAIAPGATILLVESIDNSYQHLLDAATYGYQQGANQVSMSFGGNEDSSQSQVDPYFNHPGISFVASSGDGGAGVESPAVSPYVTAVGGTYLSIDSSANRISETGWSGSGGGISAYTAQPSYQNGFVSGTQRGVPDVSYNADPNSGIYVLDNGTYYQVGGTSAGAPQWAALFAIANQGRASAGKPSLGTGQTFGTNPTLYQLAGGTSYTNSRGDFYDITSGASKNGPSASVGYDTVTGLGSPVVSKLIPDLIAVPAPVTPPTVPTIGDAGFESVNVGSGNFQYVPTGSAWNFASGSGLSGNNSPFTSGNPNAPQGSQVALIQATGSFSQSVTNWAAGSYTLSFQAAKRGNSGGINNFSVMIDGNAVSTFTPNSTSYQANTTASFTVTAGTHSITFQGINSAGGDNTDFIDNVTVATATTTPPTVPTIGDAGFESVNVGSGNFQYVPTGSAWNFASGSGLSGNNSPFTSGNPNAPQGSQVALIQGTGSFSQSITNWAAGSYTISFQAAKRGNSGGINNFSVMIDGNDVSTFTPNSTSYQANTTASFTVTAGTHSITFQGINSAGGDNTDFIDNVTVATASAVPTIGDAGFESVNVGSGNFQYVPTGSAWNFASGSGLSGNNSPFTSGNPNAPQGSQVALIQATGSFSQSVTNWAAGSYILSFQAAKRGNSGGSNNFSVMIDGNVVSTFTPNSTSYQSSKTAIFTVGAGTHIITFQGINSAGGDNTSFIDNVSVAAAN